jgi:hypothetical protein
MKVLMILLTILFISCAKKTENAAIKQIMETEAVTVTPKDNTFTVKYKYHGGIDFTVKAYIFTNAGSLKGYVIIKSIKANDDIYTIDYTGDRYTELIHNHKIFTVNNGKYCLEDEKFRDAFRTCEAMLSISKYNTITVNEPEVYQAGIRMTGRKYGVAIK